MDVERRTLIRLAGLGAGAALAGCLELGAEPGDGSGNGGATPGSPTETPGDPGPTVADAETAPLTVESARPPWYEDGEVGHAVVVDSRPRARSALARHDVAEDREDDVRALLEGVDFEDDRLVVVESVGPNGCHDELEIEAVGVEDGRLRAEAAVVDTSEGGMLCTQALVYPSALLRVTFDGDPVDEVAVDVTDGWEETATVTASADDPLPSPEPEDLPGHVRPDEDPDPVAPLECDSEGVRRHDQWYEEADVQWGDFERDGEVALSLRVDDLEYEYGDSVTVTLTNVAGDVVETGNREKYNLQVYTDEGWQDVRVKDDDASFGYTDDAVAHAPGDGFEWSIELTEEGIVEGTYHDDARVCPDLGPGRYRFAYFGVIGDGAVAVSFDLIE